jgi:hypothetical protein
VTLGRYKRRDPRTGALAHSRKTDRIVGPRRIATALVAVALASTVFIGSAVLVSRSATEACARDQDTVTVLRGILIRAKTTNAEFYSQGVRSEAEYKRAERDYSIGLSKLKTPVC